MFDVNFIFFLYRISNVKLCCFLKLKIFFNNFPYSQFEWRDLSKNVSKSSRLVRLAHRYKRVYFANEVFFGPFSLCFSIFLDMSARSSREPHWILFSLIIFWLAIFSTSSSCNSRSWKVNSFFLMKHKPTLLLQF